GERVGQPGVDRERDPDRDGDLGQAEVGQIGRPLLDGPRLLDLGDAPLAVAARDATAAVAVHRDHRARVRDELGGVGAARQLIRRRDVAGARARGVVLAGERAHHLVRGDVPARAVAGLDGVADAARLPLGTHGSAVAGGRRVAARAAVTLIAAAGAVRGAVE